MHNKIISPAGWPFHQPVTQQIKLGRDGTFLGSNDRNAFLKRASHSFVSIMDRLKLASDEVPLHVLALGATEKWGANRNGDGFLCDTCRQHCHTFKNARWYYNHIHNNPARSYGIIKAAVFNEDMARVELLVALNASKSAAERNGGLIAEKTLKLASSGKPVATSMGCRIPYDICSACNNKARTRKYYCDETKCAGGGCKNNLGKLVKIGSDMHHLHVENPSPVWYDISDVSDTRPADRTAYGSLADWMGKAASAEGFAEGYGGSQAAELFGIYPSVWDPVHPEATVLEKAAIALGRTQGQHGLTDDVLAAVSSASTPTPQEFFQKISSKVPAGTRMIDLLSAMAKQGAILPLGAFAVLSGRTAAAKEAAQYLPRAQEKLAMEIEDQVAQSSWACRDVPLTLSPSASVAVDQAYGLTKNGVQHRTLVSSSERKTAFVKTASKIDIPVSETARLLAEDYTMYKTSAVALAPCVNFTLTARLAAGQNLVL